MGWPHLGILMKILMAPLDSPLQQLQQLLERELVKVAGGLTQVNLQNRVPQASVFHLYQSNRQTFSLWYFVLHHYSK